MILQGQPTMPLIETLPAPVLDPVIEPGVRDDDFITLEPRYRVLIHNDDVTPYNYVIRILERVFQLSEEIAEHVAWTAHHEGVAVVVVRPRPEAEKLIKVARAKARGDGYPLTFSLERDE